MPTEIPAVERLGDLLAYLLTSPQGRTLQEILTDVPGYGGPSENARVQFARDKRMLRAEGVEVETRTDRSGEVRYLVDPRRFYLPDLGLDPEEVQALWLAVTAVRLEGADGSNVGWLFGTRPGGEAGLGLRLALPSSELLPRLNEAVVRRRVVQFRYGGLERVVEPYGLLFRDDFWYLSGLDRTRGAPRNFRVDRIEGEVRLGEPGAFERPVDYDPAAALPDQPWRLGSGEPVVTDVWVDAVLAARAARDADRVVERRDDGSIVVRLEVTSVEGLRSWLFGFLDRAVVLGPPEVRKAVVDWLEGMCR
jgi:predicted DNA-binding transcriptional regulator YafY